MIPPNWLVQPLESYILRLNLLNSLILTFTLITSYTLSLLYFPMAHKLGHGFVRRDDSFHFEVVVAAYE